MATLKIRTRLLLATFATGAVFVGAATPAMAAAPACSDLFSRGAVTFTQRASISRSRVLDLLKATPDVPAFLRRTTNGDVPVILLTDRTAKKIRELTDASIGTMFVQQVGYRNDHGLMRVGQNIVDVDMPGARGYGELNRNGIAWKDLQAYLLRWASAEAMGQRVYNKIEIGFLLTPQELETAKFYQIVRRASIIRVPFTFGGAQADMNQANMLSAGEHCFIFCKGSAISSHVNEIRGKMRELGINDVDAFMTKPEVQAYLDTARAALLATNPNDGTQLNWSAVNRDEMTQSLLPILPEGLEPIQRRTLINWIVGLDASDRYNKLRTALGISYDSGTGDMNSPRASFVLVYASESNVASFREATFTSPGVFYNWDNVNQSPLAR